MSDDKVCVCSGAPTVIFACSGAADVGEVADRAARRLTGEGKGKMFCLAGIGGRVTGILKTTEAAERILTIDGCGLDCARRSLDEAGFTNFEALRLTDVGMEKGKTPPTEENVSRAMEAATERLGNGS